MKNQIIIALFLIIVTFDLKAQFSTIEFFGAKSVGIGSCISISDDINSIYGNVAGSSNISNLEADISFENRFQAINLSTIGFGIAKKISKAGTIGITLKKFGISEYNEFQAGLNYARKLTEALSIGVRFNMYNLLIEEYGNRTGFNADIGLQYGLNDKLSLGFYMINPLPVKFVDQVNLPTLAFLGIQYKATDKLRLFAEIEKHFDREIFIKVGLQFDLVEKLSFYGGFRNDLDQFSDFSFGLMYAVNPMIHVNFCSQYNTTFGLSPALGISYIRK